MPEDFGLISMTMVVITASEVFIDIGFSASLIQKQDVSRQQYSTIFYINLMVGAILMGIFTFGADLLASFYDNERVAILTKVLSINFLISSLSTIQIVQLKKSLNFQLLSKSSIISTTLSGLIAVYMALNGYGLWSLVVLNLAERAIYTSIIWIRSSWRPTWEFSMGSVKELIGFSSYMFFNDVVSQAFNRLDALFIGKIYAASTLGYYDRGKSLNNMVINLTSKSFNKVFFPCFQYYSKRRIQTSKSL